MVQLVFGLAKVAVETSVAPNDVKIYLGRLGDGYKIGDTFKDGDLQKQEVLLTFDTEEGLDVLMKALKHCKDNFLRIPDELRMGA